ncbi:MAG: DUF1003 domain-containing protein [Nocardioidaceae bacterium]
MTRAESRSERRAERLAERLAERRGEGGRPDVDRDGARGARLDTPRELRRSLVPRRRADNDQFGVYAERFALFMGTDKVLIWMTLVVVLWIGWNVLVPHAARFDEYPFIFLTLMLSLQASYAAPLILLAQNRQENRDRVVAERDRQMNAASHADMEFLAREVASLRMALGEVATRDFLRSELRALLTELEERGDESADDADDPPDDADVTVATERS